MVKNRGGKQQQQSLGDAADRGDAGEGGWRSDPRFGHLATDPRYRSASARKATRVEIDSRFKAMFSDPDFTTDARSDKRGRPVAMSSRQDLRRFYGLKQDEEAEAETDKREKEDATEDGEEVEAEEHEEEAEEPTDEEKDSQDDEEEEEDDEDVEEEAEEEELEKAESSSEDEEFRSLERSTAAEKLAQASDAAVEPTSRLAVTQQDWDQLKATDLYMLLSCRCQASRGRLLSVTVYPSRFGQRRMAAEATSGPLELAAAPGKKPSSAAAPPASDAATYHRSLRRHQMKRLWYYYAVAEFDSAETAASVFEQCSGLEIESTGGCLRLSYVPEGMQFGGPEDVPEDWRHLVTRCTGLDPAAYKPGKFATASLGRTQVGITWDATPAERTRYLQGLFAKQEFDEADPDLKRLSDFLAMSSDEDEDEEGNGAVGDAGRKAAAVAARRRALLGGPGEVSGEAAVGGDQDEVAAFSDDELPDDAADAAAAFAPAAAADAAPPGGESRKRSRRRRLKEQAKRAKLAKAGLLPRSAAGGGSSDSEDAAPAAEMPASEQELAMLVADRTAAGPARGRVTAAEVASDARFGALFTDSSYHVDPTHSEAAKAAEVQRLIVSAKRRAAMDT